MISSVSAGGRMPSLFWILFTTLLYRYRPTPLSSLVCQTRMQRGDTPCTVRVGWKAPELKLLLQDLGSHRLYPPIGDYPFENIKSQKKHATARDDTSAHLLSIINYPLNIVAGKKKKKKNQKTPPERRKNGRSGAFNVPQLANHSILGIGEVWVNVSNATANRQGHLCPMEEPRLRRDFPHMYARRKTEKAHEYPWLRESWRPLEPHNGLWISSYLIVYRRARRESLVNVTFVPLI